MTEYDDGGIDWASFELPPEATQPQQVQIPHSTTDRQTSQPISNTAAAATSSSSSDNPYPSRNVLLPNQYDASSDRNLNVVRHVKNVDENQMELERLRAELALKNEEVFDLQASLGRYINRKIEFIHSFIYSFEILMFEFLFLFTFPFFLYTRSCRRKRIKDNRAASTGSDQYEN